MTSKIIPPLNGDYMIPISEFIQACIFNIPMSERKLGKYHVIITKQMAEELGYPISILGVEVLTGKENFVVNLVKFESKNYDTLPEVLQQLDTKA